MTTSQNKSLIFSAADKSISLLQINIPPKAEVGSHANAAS